MMDRPQVNIAAAGAEAVWPTVLQVVPALVTGGAERGAVDVAVALAEAGGKSLVASEGGPMERELARAGVLHITLPLASKSPLMLYRNRKRLESVIRQHGVDIVHARSRAPAWSAYYAARCTGARFMTTFHGTYNFKNALKRRYNAIMVKGERVIANSKFIAEHIRANYEIEESRLRIVQRGVDLARFDPERVSAERVVHLANRWRVADGVPLVLLPGRLTRWKGQRLLIDAVAQLSDLQFHCILAGSDQGRSGYRNELETAIRQRGLENRIYLPGECEDMPAAYMLADVVVSASTDPEAFGRVIGEAHAMGCPVVAADHGGVREQVLVDQTAFLFPPGDVEALAAALRRALSLDSPAREHVARQAGAHARAGFSKQRMCEQTLAIYRELATTWG